MISLLKKILTKGNKFSEFQAVSIREIEIPNVYLKTQTNQLDVSNTHWLVCIEPATFGVWIPHDIQCQIGQKAELIFTKSGTSRVQILANVQLKHSESIKLPEGNLHLFISIHTRLYLSNPLFRSIFYHFFYKKPEIDLEKFKVLAAAFCYPRKVRLISYQEPGHKNFFPMDLLSHLPETQYYILDLRHTNPSLPKILVSKKLVVGEFDIEKKETIYKYAKNHITSESQYLTSSTKKTETFHFEIPDWIKSYSELNILLSRNLGSQMLLLGQIQNEVMDECEADPLYHVHFLYYLEQKKYNSNLS